MLENWCHPRVYLVMVVICLILLPWRFFKSGWGSSVVTQILELLISL